MLMAGKVYWSCMQSCTVLDSEESTAKETVEDPYSDNDDGDSDDDSESGDGLAKFMGYTMLSIGSIAGSFRVLALVVTSLAVSYWQTFIW